MDLFHGSIRRTFGLSYSAPSMVRRLVVEHGLEQWRSYSFVALMMAVTAGCISAAAYLLGHAINLAYVSRSMSGVMSVGAGIIVAAALRGFASYGQAVELARI